MHLISLIVVLGWQTEQQQQTQLTTNTSPERSRQSDTMSTRTDRNNRKYCTYRNIDSERSRQSETSVRQDRASQKHVNRKYPFGVSGQFRKIGSERSRQPERSTGTFSNALFRFSSLSRNTYTGTWYIYSNLLKTAVGCIYGACGCVPPATHNTPAPNKNNRTKTTP